MANLDLRTATKDLTLEEIGLVFEICLLWLLVLIVHLYLSGMWLYLAPRTDTKTHVLKKDRTMCSEYNNHSRFNNEH